MELVLVLLAMFLVFTVYASHPLRFGGFGSSIEGLKGYSHGGYVSNSGKSKGYRMKGDAKSNHNEEPKIYEGWKHIKASKNYSKLKSYGESRGYGLYSGGFRHRPRSRRGHRLSRPGRVERLWYNIESPIKTTTQPCESSLIKSPSAKPTRTPPSFTPTSGKSVNEMNKLIQSTTEW